MQKRVNQFAGSDNDFKMILEMYALSWVCEGSDVMTSTVYYIPHFIPEWQSGSEHMINPLSTRPHQNVVWYNNSWLGFLNILKYVPKERDKFSAKNEPSFVTVICSDGS